MSAVREYWRVTLLVLLLVGSAVALFAPGLADEATADNATNLEYGLELSGGARVRTTVVGTTAENVDVLQGDEQTVEQSIAESLELDRSDVRVRSQTGTVEVYADVEEAAFRDALSEAGLQPETIRDGVTERTRSEIVETLRVKIDASGFASASVQDVESQTDGTHFIVVQAANRNVSEVRSIVESRGVVQVLAYYPDENGNQTNSTVLTQQQLMESQIGLPTTTQQDEPAVPVTLTESTAGQFADDMVQYGFTQSEAASNCDGAGADYCLLTMRDGEQVYSAGVRASLAQSFQNGEFVKDPSFIITATSMEEARQLYGDLQAGSLPAPLSIEDTFYVSPSLGAAFKVDSLIIGLAAALTVSLVVFFRYGEVKVALPMLVTALSEVAILLGFAAVTNLALNLSHIAGFIAVIGTGVDDLIIIADEVMAERVSSRRVFRSRFRKALWIIGAAAVTTIIAMSPLAVLSLGDLRGFAIVTILGVLIGVIITRPAYGDILRRLLTDAH